MLCEERGLFLEIADIVRGLGLTILKGVMEARDDKVWARFAVEVLPNLHPEPSNRLLFLTLDMPIDFTVTNHMIGKLLVW